MDQAAALRDMMETPVGLPYGGGSRVPAVVVGSGKGGTGKSVIAVLLARALAVGGARVLLVDGEDELANLHVMLHVEPRIPIDAVMDGSASAADLVVRLADRLWLCTGGSGSPAVRDAGPLDRARMFQRIADNFVDYDVVVIDAGAGVDGVVRACTVAGTHLMMVTVPEPAALTDCFAVTKIVRTQIVGFPVDVSINRTDDEREGIDASMRFRIACRRFLSFDSELLGVAPENAALGAHVRKGRNLLDLDAANPVALVVDRMARRYQARLGQDAEAVLTS